MTTQSYLIINTSVDPAVCENIAVWDGNTETWNPGENYVAVPADSTVALLWSYEKSSNSFVLIESVGSGKVGYTWDGEKLTTNAPKPIYTPHANNTVSNSNTVTEIKNF